MNSQENNIFYYPIEGNKINCNFTTFWNEALNEVFSAFRNVLPLKSLKQKVDFIATYIQYQTLGLYMQPSKLIQDFTFVFSLFDGEKSSSSNTNSSYVVCNGFRLTKWDDYLWSQFWPLLNQALFLEKARTVLKIGSSLKPNRHQEI